MIAKSGRPCKLLVISKGCAIIAFIIMRTLRDGGQVMAQQKGARRPRAILLIVIGILMMAAAGVWYGWQEHESRQLRASLRQTPTAVAPEPTATLVPTLTATTVPPTPTTPTPAATTAPTRPTTATAGLTTPPTATAPVPTATSIPTLAPSGTVTPAPITTSVPAPAGVPVRIVIPALKIDAKVVEMGWTTNGSQSEWDMSVLKEAVGHHINSAPLGVPGNVVISGHNNIYGAEFKPVSQSWPTEPGQWQRVDDFTDRSDILNGLVIHLYNAAGQQFDYTIEEFYRLKDTGVPLEQRVKNASFMQPTSDARLTLVTCWPVWSNTHRLIVVARPGTP